MRENCTSGSVAGAPGNGRPYAGYSRFGIFCIFVSSVTDSLRHPWKTKFQGNLNAAHDIGLS